MTAGMAIPILRVKGKAVDKFDFVYLGETMPGAGQGGGFLAQLPTGVDLDPQRLSVIVNNKLLPVQALEFNHAADVLTINGLEEGENYVSICGFATNGNLGSISVPVTFSNAPRTPRDEVIYFPMTDRFLDGDPSLNTHTGREDLHPLVTYLGGDWAGITQKIEDGYFNDLGVTTLWIAPQARNTPKIEQESVEPGRFFTSYHGYWPISSTETNEQFGSMEDLRLLVDTAHDNGIAIILDFVVNHVHEDHPLFQEHPEWAVPLETPDGRQNIRMFDEFPLTTWFDTFLPTLDYENQPEITERMVDNAVYWLNTTGADGFRHDAVKHIPTPFWRALTSRLNAEFSGADGRGLYQVGETISGHGLINEYVGPDLLNGQFDFPTYFAIQDVLARGNGSMADLDEAARKAWALYPLSSIMSPLLGNHDVPRFMAIADGDMIDGMKENEVGFQRPPEVDDPESYRKLRLAFAFVMTFNGPPTIYYGDEIGITGAGDPDNRRPMIWNDWSDEQEQTNALVGKLAKARQESIALRRGVYQSLHADEGRLLFARVSPGETVLVALNRSAVDQGMTLQWPAHWGSPAGLEELVTSGISAEAFQDGVRLYDGPWSFGIWRVNW